VQLTPQICQKSSMYLNQHVTKLHADSAAFYVHYWGGKPQHHGNVMHSHPFFEICYVVEGEGRYTNKGVTYSLQRGTLYCSKPGGLHQLQSETGMLVLFVAFEIIEADTRGEVFQLLDKLTNYHHLFIPDAEQTPPVLLWKSLVLQAAERLIPFPQLIFGLSHALLLSLISFFFQHSGIITTPPEPDTGFLSSPIKNAKAYILAHLSDKLTLKEVGQAIHLSERQLSRLLSVELGQSFPSFVRSERIKRAAYLLAFTDMTLLDVAQASGYEMVHYFSKVFVEVLGITPGKFRKRVVGNKLEAATIHQYLWLTNGRN
jgi:AraC-like DNA-binding protein/quercetin dioxygenase-like cupin family protein